MFAFKNLDSYGVYSTLGVPRIVVWPEIHIQTVRKHKRSCKMCRRPLASRQVRAERPQRLLTRPWPYLPLSCLHQFAMNLLETNTWEQSSKSKRPRAPGTQPNPHEEGHAPGRNGSRVYSMTSLSLLMQFQTDTCFFV